MEANITHRGTRDCLLFTAFQLNCEVWMNLMWEEDLNILVSKHVPLKPSLRITQKTHKHTHEEPTARLPAH